MNSRSTPAKANGAEVVVAGIVWGGIFKADHEPVISHTKKIDAWFQALIAVSSKWAIPPCVLA